MKTEARFQLGFAALHFYAAIVALIAAGMHFGASRYHWNRFMGR